MSCRDQFVEFNSSVLQAEVNSGKELHSYSESLSICLLIFHSNKHVSFILLDFKGIPAQIGRSFEQQTVNEIVNVSSLFGTFGIILLHEWSLLKFVIVLCF